MTDVLYLTHNGITDHIGQSQIAPYNLGLARRGYRIHIVSVEKPGREALMERYRRRFEDVGIKWSWVTYHNRPQVAAQLYDMARMRALALRIARAERPRLVHSRSWLPLEVGLAVKKATGAKFVLDFRHFFIEDGLEDSPYKFVYRLLGTREKTYFAQADQVVTLTHRAAEILDAQYPHPAGLARYTVIRCCADFDQFDVSRTDPAKVANLRTQLGIAPGAKVLMYLGSIGPRYLVREMLLLFRELRGLNSNARFLFLCNNGREQIMAEAASLGIPQDALIVTTAPRDEVPNYLALTDASVLFYRPDVTSAGCSPTKMSELFAANIPVIANTGVGDLDTILDPARNGSTAVQDFRPETLRAALENVFALGQERSFIRDRTREFDLETGVDRYQSVYERLIGAPASPVAARAAVAR